MRHFALFTLFPLALLVLGQQRRPYDMRLLRGAWMTPGEPSFSFAVGDTTILFEFDMKEHSYRLSGDTLVIDFGDPTLGVQRKLILALSDSLLVFKDITSEPWTTGTYVRMRD